MNDPVSRVTRKDSGGTEHVNRGRTNQMPPLSSRADRKLPPVTSSPVSASTPTRVNCLTSPTRMPVVVTQFSVAGTCGGSAAFRGRLIRAQLVSTYAPGVGPGSPDGRKLTAAQLQLS